MQPASNLNASGRNSSATPRDPYRLQCLDRALAVLEYIGESNVPLSLAEICRSMNLHKSTAHRALMVLERGMLLERTPDDRFRLGLKLYTLGNRAVEQMDLRAKIQPSLRVLSRRLGETVHLGVLQRTSVVYLDKAGPTNRVCMGSKTGSSNPAYCTAMGKAMLAWLPQTEVHDIVDQISFVRLTAKTICSREELMRALERVRRRGYSIDDEEVETGVRCIGVPVFDEKHNPIAALSVSCVSSRIQPHQVPAIAEHLRRTCSEISASLRLHCDLRDRVMIAPGRN
ncbi:MAG TPA: IclR family transcriptional regulator [Acidobacteriaceae bacterium]|nr:IclR family transcriptional regulator [Acidobacteriaceae bacterium]